jgi:rhamnogalacturonyl hydrolase YesR
LGISAVLIGQSNQTYFNAASREESSVINTAPRFWNGAISHRYNTPELWADFVYMAPPFLAYYAVATKNSTLLRLAIEQCQLYRQILQANVSEPFTGLWEHIIGPEDFQPQLWSTGNAWAAAGMTRVLATTIKWDHSSTWAYEQRCLTQWIKEILDGTIQSRKVSIDPSTGLLRNVLNDTTWFGETSGTALLSSVVYRMAVLAPGVFFSEGPHIEWAERSRKAIGLHVGADGILSPAINPLAWGNHTPYTSGSPEGESFGVLLGAAYRDWLYFLKK